MRLLSILSIVPCVSSVIRGINLFGLETEHSSLMCDWSHDYRWLLAKVQQLGFNTIRLPFSHDFLHNTDMSAMDHFFENILETGLDVVLDYHRIYNSHQSPKPYDDTHSFDDFINDWLFVVDRYKHNSHLVGLDLFNEFQSDDAVEWNDLAKKTIDAIEDAHPFRFFYMVGCVSWGGNCQHMDVSSLPNQNRIFYTIHKYIWSDDGNLEDKWDTTFGRFVGNGSKIIVGETGFKSDLPNQVDWFKHFLRYLKSRNITNTFFWTLSPNSVDTAGILLDDCTSVDTSKMHLLWDFWDFWDTA